MQSMQHASDAKTLIPVSIPQLSANSMHIAKLMISFDRFDRLNSTQGAGVLQIFDGVWRVQNRHPRTQVSRDLQSHITRYTLCIETVCPGWWGDVVNRAQRGPQKLKTQQRLRQGKS